MNRTLSNAGLGYAIISRRSSFSIPVGKISMSSG
ncbi:uncharacterized protein METZ01_LOCUS80313 [marine metagenome]|uniref:Uncharacterized protein n=1 Tax=marine metagenome TaxID=408172 RepID=A0A381UH34_9ZZZZ